MTDFLFSYNVRDFVLFSRESLASVLTAYNAEMWPWQIAFLVTSLTITWSLWKSNARAVCVLAALAWFWTGLDFHLQHFRAINWAAVYFGWAFVVQAVLLVASARPASVKVRARNSPHFALGSAIFLGSAFLPLSGLLGYPVEALTAFGWGDAATALGTVGLLLALEGKRLILFVIPLAYLALAVLIEMSLR